MKIMVLVKPHAKENSAELLKDNQFSVHTKASPNSGKANKATRALLAQYFDVPQSHVRFLTGYACRRKIFEII